MGGRLLLPACAAAYCAVVAMALGGSVAAAEIIHDTQSEFAPGSFHQTVLVGTEAAPEIRLDSYSSFNWTFEDDDITGWSFTPGGGVAEENPTGQIHVRALSSGGETYAFANRAGLTIPNQFVAEFRMMFDALQPSGVVDPFANQPTGGCCRIDVQNATAGMRVDVFNDRMVAFYREGTAGANYPTLAYFDYVFNTGQWYVLRFEADFTAPGMPVQVYVDGAWAGELKADARSAATATFRVMAYSRTGTSGLSEEHVDYAKLGTVTDTYYSDGTYTSPVLDLHAVSFGVLSWSGPQSVYPWGQWVKYAGNPVVSGTALVENILHDIDDPLQQPIQYDGKYWMVWATSSTINLSYSTDPNLLVWTNYGSNPVLSPTPGVENYVYSPQIFKDGDTYYLVYDVSVISLGAQVVAYATASAPTGPYTKGQYILDLGASGEWDDLRVTEPYVFKEGDTYYLYYMGDHGCSGCKEQIGLATTSASLFPLGSEPGGVWTKHGMVLPNGSGPTDWDRGLTADPSVIKVGDTYYMRYTGSYANAHWQLGTAWADNPFGPWNHPAGPDITLGPPGAWDSDRLVRGAIHFHNGRYYSPYTGALGSYQGGMATADPIDQDNTLIFETSSSDDGVVWDAWQPVLNGAQIASTPQRYLQYRATFIVQSGGVSPSLSSVTINYEEAAPGLVSLEPPATVMTAGEETTLWIHLNADVYGVKGASFAVSYDPAYVTAQSVVNGPELPASGFVSSVINSSEVLIDIAILEGTFNGPGSLVGIVLRAHGATASTPMDFNQAILRDSENRDILHGNQGATLQILADTEPPTAEVTAPPSGNFYRTLPTLTVDFSDNSGLDRASYQIDDCLGPWTPLWAYNSGESDTTINLTMPTVSGGLHAVYFRVTDDAGNVNSDMCTYTWSFTYDDTRPTVFVVSPPSGGLRNTLPVLAIDFSDNLGLDRGYYQLNHCNGPWTELWSHDAGVSDTSIIWTMPGVSESLHAVYFKVTDDAGNVNADSCSYSWSFTYDITPPPAPTSFMVTAGHQKCKLNWVNPTGGGFAGVMVRRNPWGAGAYPEYDDDFPAPLGYPADQNAGDLVYQGTAQSFRDSSGTLSMPRNVYYYSIFSYDAAGNYSALTTAQQGRATNYWLGDVSGNGSVYYEDLVLFSNTYRTTFGEHNYNPQFDIGPTYSGSAHGIPVTDNAVQFEDLVVFSINFSSVGPNMKTAPVFADHTVDGPLGLGLSLVSEPSANDETVVVAVSLRNNPGIVKAIYFTLPYDRAHLTYVGMQQSEELKKSPAPAFFDVRDNNGQVEVSLALLGGETVIDGSGEIARAQFRLKAGRNIPLTVGQVDMRDGENNALAAAQSPQTSIEYTLPVDGHVSLKMYNVTGQLVRTLVDEDKPAGYYTTTWDSRSTGGAVVASGTYFYRLSAGDYTATRKMILLK